MKRVWHRATVAAEDGFYLVMLDGKPVRLPNGAALRLRGRALAEAIAAQWDGAGGGYGGEMSLDLMGLTRLAGNAQLRIAADPSSSVASIAAYARTDLLCYRAETPAELVARQAEAWDPWLGWAERRYGARLRVGSGIMPVSQPEAALDALRDAVEVLDPNALAGLEVIVANLGSLVLGLAILEGVISAAEGHGLSIVDELHQESVWGCDPEQAARRRAVAAQIAEAADFLVLSRGDSMFEGDSRLGM